MHGKFRPLQTGKRIYGALTHSWCKGLMESWFHEQSSLPDNIAVICRAGAAESQQDEYHDPERCAEDDSEAGKPLLQEHVEGRQEEAASSSAFASGSCEKQYWSCPGDAGFKVGSMPPAAVNLAPCKCEWPHAQPSSCCEAASTMTCQCRERKQLVDESECEQCPHACSLGC